MIREILRFEGNGIGWSTKEPSADKVDTVRDYKENDADHHNKKSGIGFASSLKGNARLMTTGLSSTLLTQTDDYRVGRFTIMDTELRV